MSAEFEELYTAAHAAGQRAALEAIPTPMLVGEPTTLLGDDINYKKPTSYVSEGVCGFAWIVIKPGTSKFARWLKQNKLARRDEYYGGVTVWVSDYNQSYTRKSAYAHAFANVLQDAGIRAIDMDRLD